MAGFGFDSDAAGTGPHSFDGRETMMMATVTEQYAKVINEALGIILGENLGNSRLCLLAERRGAETQVAYYRDLLALADAGDLHISPSLRAHLRWEMEYQQGEVERLTSALREVE